VPLPKRAAAGSPGPRPAASMGSIPWASHPRLERCSLARPPARVGQSAGAGFHSGVSIALEAGGTEVLRRRGDGTARWTDSGHAAHRALASFGCLIEFRTRTTATGGGPGPPTLASWLTAYAWPSIARRPTDTSGKRAVNQREEEARRGAEAAGEGPRGGCAAGAGVARRRTAAGARTGSRGARRRCTRQPRPRLKGGARLRRAPQGHARDGAARLPPAVAHHRREVALALRLTRSELQEVEVGRSRTGPGGSACAWPTHPRPRCGSGNRSLGRARPSR
jgi:hypothetical protein